MDNLELILFNYSKKSMPRVGGYRLCIRVSKKASEERQSNFIIRLTGEKE